MDLKAPIWTERTVCQDCYKCIRECPVKAIRVMDGWAAVQPAECVVCGHCVAVCPNHAKHVRDDLPQAQALVAAGRPVAVSLAPSWVVAFPGLEARRLVAALRRLGFATVGETARGAQEVNANVAALLKREPPRVWLSSACPAAVDYLKKRHPELGARVTDLLSPMLTHARMLRRWRPDLAAVVFIGPCFAKKREAAQFPGLVDVAITFDDLKRWLTAAGLDPAAVEPRADDRFQPEAAAEGALYPVEGGMLAGLKDGCDVVEPSLLAVSGLGELPAALAGLSSAPDRPVFVEVLACRGGCINGPGMTAGGGTLARRQQVARAVGEARRKPRAPQLGIEARWTVTALSSPGPEAAALTRALARVGKSSPQDELNCGGCGYDSCRDLARALAAGRAEPEQCVSYMRKLAQGKADALLRAMPAAVVLVDDRLRVVDCNRPFAELAGPDAAQRFAAGGGLRGEPLEPLVPFSRRFRYVLETGEELLGADVRRGELVQQVSIFTIEAGRLVGGIIQDATAPAGRRAQVVARAQKVIEKNLETIQRIAYLLGENAAETEGILTNIIGSFAPDEEPSGEGEGER